MKQSLGTILVDAGLITKAQLDRSLELQKVYRERLASILVRQNHLTEKFAVSYLGRQLDVPAVDLSRHTISLDLLNVVSLVVCSQKMVFPVQLQGSTLQLAMADPLNQAVVAELAREHQLRLRPCIALEASIKNAIEEAAIAVRTGRRVFTPSALHHRLPTLSLDPRRRPLAAGNRSAACNPARRRPRGPDRGEARRRGPRLRQELHRYRLEAGIARRVFARPGRGARRRDRDQSRSRRRARWFWWTPIRTPAAPCRTCWTNPGRCRSWPWAAPRRPFRSSPTPGCSSPGGDCDTSTPSSCAARPGR